MEDTMWIDNSPAGSADSVQPAIKKTQLSKTLHLHAKCENY